MKPYYFAWTSFVTLKKRIALSIPEHTKNGFAKESRQVMGSVGPTKVSFQRPTDASQTPIFLSKEAE